MMDGPGTSFPWFSEGPGQEKKRGKKSGSGPPEGMEGPDISMDRWTKTDPSLLHVSSLVAELTQTHQ